MRKSSTTSWPSKMLRLTDDEDRGRGFFVLFDLNEKDTCNKWLLQFGYNAFRVTLVFCFLLLFSRPCICSRATAPLGACITPACRSMPNSRGSLEGARESFAHLVGT